MTTQEYATQTEVRATISLTTPQSSYKDLTTERLIKADGETTSLPSTSESSAVVIPNEGLEDLAPTDEAPKDNDLDLTEKVDEIQELGGENFVGTTVTAQVTLTTTLSSAVVDSEDGRLADGSVGEKEQVVDEPKDDAEVITSKDVGVSFPTKPATSPDGQQEDKVTQPAATPSGDDLPKDVDSPAMSTVSSVTADKARDEDTEKIRPTTEGTNDVEKISDTGGITTKANDLGQESTTPRPPDVTTIVQHDGVTSLDISVQAEPGIGRILEADDGSVKETTKSDVDHTEVVTQPTEMDTTVVVPGESNDAENDGVKSDGVSPGPSEFEPEHASVRNAALKTKESLKDYPILEVVRFDYADSEQKLLVQTRDDDDGVNDTVDGQTSKVDDNDDDDETGDDTDSEEGEKEKVVTLDDMTGKDAKDEDVDDEEDDEDESSKDKIDTQGKKVIDLEEAEKRWGGNSTEEGEEGSGSADEDLGSTESDEAHAAEVHDGHSTGDDHHNSTGHGHVDHESHRDSAEDKENKKRTAIIVGVALGGAALLTLGIFTTRQCKQKAKFTPLQKAKEQNDPEAIEFRPVSQSGTALESDTGTASGRPPSALDKKNGLYRHGPSMGPPSPRFARKAEDGKFRFPDSPTPDGKLSPSASPLLSQSPAENGTRRNPKLHLAIQPKDGAQNGDPPTKPAKPATPETSPGQGGQPTQAEGLYRQGPRMGPPSPRMHRKAEGKFDFPVSSATTPSPSGSPTPGGATRI